MSALSKAIKADSLSGYQIELTAKLMRQTFKRRLREANTGVTIDQWVLLQQLSQRDGISQLELANAVYKDAPTVTRIIDLLEERNYIRRGPDQADRRKFLIHLTQKGRTKIAEIIPLVSNFRQQVFSGINKTQLAQFQKTLDIVFQNLQ